MLVRLLGSVQLDTVGNCVNVGPPQRCAVLAALAADAGRLVTHATLVDRVWGPVPPLRALRTAQTHVTNLRSLLARIDARAQTTVTVRRRSGYVLDVDPDLVDVLRMRRLAAEAGDHSRPAVDRLARWREAVGLWRGEPLAGLAGEWIERTRQAWYDEYREVVINWALAEIDAGHPTAALGRLDALIVRYPLMESLPAVLMRALYAAGRRTEALSCYAAIRQRLDEELAERPGPQLKAVYQAILRREPTPLLPQAETRARAATVVPRQLPIDVRGFAGRADQLARLDALAAKLHSGAAKLDNGAAKLHNAAAKLDNGARNDEGAVIAAIGGTAGVGKTALAVHWAHRVADRFPDGQLYVDLRGFSPGGHVVAPAEAVRRFLDALDVPPEKIPADLDAQAALYRSILASRRMLVVVDNARDSAQVRPLLPASAGCLVVVTSRNHLSGLVAADGAHPIDVDLLSGGEARELLARRLGADRVAAERDAVAEIITRCARLPLALALVAARATIRPQVALHLLAGDLADASQRWQTLTGDDPRSNVRAVFSWSYHALTAPAARLFRLLGLHPGPDIAASASASLAGLPPDAVRPLLAELTQASLLAETTPGRYTFHDLLRGYAAHLAQTVDSDQQRQAATGRVLDHYLHTAYPADRLLDPTRDPFPLAPPSAGVTPEQLSDYPQALGWFTAQRLVLLAAVASAAATGFDSHAWRLAWALQSFLDRRGHWHDLAAIGPAAVAAAQRLADPTAQISTRRSLAAAYTRLGRFDDAHTQLRHALDLATHTGDRTQQAHTHHSLAYLWGGQGQPAQALHHDRQALTLFQAAGHRTGQAYALNGVGWYCSLLGQHQQALAHCRQAMTLHQQVGDRLGQAHTWDSLGYIHHHLGRHSQAATCYQYALALSRDLGDRFNEADVLTHLGDTHHAAGNPQPARDAWRQALAILDDLDHPDAEKVCAKLAELEPPTDQTAGQAERSPRRATDCL